jgi:hypothetical protein
MNGGLANIKTLSSANGLPTGLFRNRQGMFSICQINGVVQPISTPDIDYIINNYTVPTDATGFGYTLAGRAFYQITFNQEEKTWLYDFQSGMWSRLKSHDITRHIADRGVAFNAAYYVTHYLTGDLLKLNIDTFTDDGSIIEREATFNHVFSSTQNMVKITKLRLDCETGNNASIALKISRDGGFTWGMPMITSMGNIGEYTKRAEWRKLGIARDWVLNLRMTDSVKFALINLMMLAGELNS